MEKWAPLADLGYLLFLKHSNAGGLEWMGLVFKAWAESQVDGTVHVAARTGQMC